MSYTDCLTFTGETSEFTLKATYKEWDGTLQWSTDHNTWTVLAGTEAMQSVDKKLYLRGKGNTTFFNEDGVTWQLSAKASCSGNIQTLLDWENPPMVINTVQCYSYMFFNCTNLTTAPELPATTLAESCYGNMFEKCRSLTSPPKLPATTLADYCYEGMFLDCNNLTTAPELPAVTLNAGCYSNMFSGCRRLKVNNSSGNKIFICPSTIPSGAVTNMFTLTGGTFTGTPTAGTTYYYTPYKKIPNGTYYWKDKLGSITESTYDEIIFNSNGRAFGGLTVTANTSWGLVEKISYGKNGYPMTVVAQRTSADQPLVWVDDKYKIITVDNVELTLPSYKWLYLRSNLRFSSEVEIQLYQCTCESNRVDKTEYLKLIDTISGTMRDSISVTDMSIEIEYPIPTFNYVYIPMFNRYYFVDDITAVVYGVWNVALSVDVLMTYKDTIKTLEAFVDRSQSNYNLKVIDNKLPLEKTETVEVDTVQNQLFVDNFGTYVLQGLQVSTGKAEGSN